MLFQKENLSESERRASMKRNSLKKSCVLLAAVLTTTFFTGCGDNNSEAGTETGTAAEPEIQKEETASTDEKVVIRLADQKINLHPYFSYALYTGILDEYFEGYNVEFEVNDFEGPDAIKEGIGSGHIDFASMGQLPGVTGILSGYGYKIIAVTATSKASSVIVVPDGSDIQSVEELRGKRIGVGIGSAAHYTLGLLLETGGLTLDDVELVNVTTDAAATAVRNEELDAVVIINGTAQVLQEEGSGQILISEVGEPLLQSVLLASDSFAENYPEYTSLIIEAYQAVNEAIDADRDAFWTWYENEIGTDISGIQGTWDIIDRNVEPVNDSYKGQLEKLLAWLEDNDLVDVSNTSADDIYDNTFINETDF